MIIPPQARVLNPAIETVNLLGCSTQRAVREAKDYEVLLEAADGMDWETMVGCDVVYLAKKAELVRRRGSVTYERRRALGSKIIPLRLLDGLSRYFLFAISTAYTWRSPCILLRNTIHFPSGVKVTFGSRR